MTPITVIGNLTSRPELQYTSSGTPVANFTVAVNKREFNKATQEWESGQATFFRCHAWGEQAENISESLGRGMEVVVYGNIGQRSFTDRNGNERTVYEVDAKVVGASLRWGAIGDGSGGQRENRAGGYSEGSGDGDAPF